MAPRRTRRAIASPESEPPSPSLAPASRPASTSQEGFNLGDAPGSDKSSHSDYDRYVNDPDAIPAKSKSSAVEVNFFFDKTGPKAVCKVCR